MLFPPKFLVSVNGRPFDETVFSADPNDEDQRVLCGPGFLCRDLRVTELQYEQSKESRILTAELTDSRGQPCRIRFLTGSEEALYRSE